MVASKVAVAQKTSKKDRSVTDAGEPVLTGDVFRGSPVVPDCVKQREAALFRDKFGTYDKNGSTGKSEKKKHRRLDKVWVFASHHKLTPIKRRKFSAVENHKKHSMLSALVSDHYVDRELYTFALKSEVAEKKSSKMLVEKLDLAFDDMETALKWRQAIAQQIGVIRRRDKPSLDAVAALDFGTASEDGTAMPGLAESRRETGNGASLSSFEGASRQPHDESSDDMATPTGTPHPGSMTDDDEPASLVARNSSLEMLHRELRMDARIRQDLNDWRVITYESDITVLRGTEQHNADSIMLSYIIRAPPRLSVKALLKRKEQKLKVESLNLTFRVIESVDEFNEVLEATWRPSGVQQFFLAPRILRVRRLWRRDDDGTYVVMFRACEPQPPDVQPSWWDWFSPIFCQLIDTCYTLSPLTGEYSGKRESGETLVTQVSCYGDMGGWLSRSHPWKRILDLVMPFTATSWASFIRPHIESSIVIRNQAEADRFCVRPFLQSHDEGTATAMRSASLAPSQASSLAHELQPPRSSFANSALAKTRMSAAGGSQNSSQDARSADSSPRDPTLPHPRETSNSIPQATPESVATCDKKYWSCPGANSLKVRGLNYLQDKKKIPAAKPVFALVAVDLLQVERPTTHIARFLPSLRASKSSFTFIMQIMFGNPSLSLTFSWAAPEQLQEELASPTASGGSLLHPRASPNGSINDEDAAIDEGELLGKPFELTLARFLAGSTTDEVANERRHGTLKLIPRISQGAWFVKQAVGTTPCLLGRKLTTHYHRGPRYFEVDVDVSSSSVAANIVGLVQGMTRSLCVDMAIVLEGHAIEELPESLLGTVRCSHLDLNSAKLLDVATGEIREKPGKGTDVKTAKPSGLQLDGASGSSSICTASINLKGKAQQPVKGA